MNGKDASSSDTRPSKRSREEMETEKAEEEEGLVALVKKRRSDVKQLEDRISTLRNELGAAAKKLEAAESLLQAMQGGSVRNENKTKKERPESGLRHDNGHGEPHQTAVSYKGNSKLLSPNGSKLGSALASQHGSSRDKALVLGTSSAPDTIDPHGSPGRSRIEHWGERAASEVDMRDRRSDGFESHARPKLSNSGREKISSEADRKDRKAQERTSRMCIQPYCVTLLHHISPFFLHLKSCWSYAREWIVLWLYSDSLFLTEAAGIELVKETCSLDAIGLVVDTYVIKTLTRTLGYYEGGETPEKVTKPSILPRQPEHADLIMSIKSKSKPQPVSFFTPVFSNSQHRRKMRNLVLNPSSENQCATSALDGVINFWQIHAKGLDINFRYTVDCLSPGQRHWPEDLTWHPDGHSLFACYTADNGDSQVSIIKNDNKQKKVQFLPAKPHIKGIVNGITFMPWSSSQFVTGGSDHMVHLWREQQEGDTWKPKLLHGGLHTSAVHGVAGMRHKQLVLSAGADKRVIGFDPVANRGFLRHDLESKAMTVLPNTMDFNLFMVQTGQPNKQLHLFDIRSRTELHTFGWQQESSDTQSTLITQSWSPDGLYTASGSADPKIVIFDIRFNGREPAQTIYAHTKRVFMAVWHQTLPLMLSISSDLNIGVHRISGK